MPDTGAPWNIPYVAGTDLVSDWPTDSQALANAIASGLDDAVVAGIGSNVVQAVKTDVFSTTSSSFTTITGLTATITPSAATSKVLLIAYVNFDGPSAVNKTTAIRFSGGNSTTFVGDASSTRVRGAYGFSSFASNRETPATLVYLDTPATASAVTYEVQIMTLTAGTVYVNRGVVDNDPDSTRMASSIIAIEVAA